MQGTRASMKVQGSWSTVIRQRVTRTSMRPTVRATRSPAALTTSTQSDDVTGADMMKQLWIGMIEVRSLHGESQILDDMRGAFVDIVTWASDAENYRCNAELVISTLGSLF